MFSILRWVAPKVFPVVRRVISSTYPMACSPWGFRTSSSKVELYKIYSSADQGSPWSNPPRIWNNIERWSSKHRTVLRPAILVSSHVTYCSGILLARSSAFSMSRSTLRKAPFTSRKRAVATFWSRQASVIVETRSWTAVYTILGTVLLRIVYLDLK